MEYIIKKNDEELMHYGVPGMKWGVRRAVRKDASVVRARKQYNQDFNDAAKAARKTKSFAITQKGKQKKALLDKDYSDKYDRMMKSQEKLKSSEANARRKIEKTMKNTQSATTEIAKERARQKKHIATKRAITAGTAFTNRYLESKGKTMRVDNIGHLAKYALDRKYVRDTFR